MEKKTEKISGKIFKKGEKILFVLLILFFISIVFSTRFFGSTDLRDYAEPAKYFADKYSANLRNSHSHMYGFVHFPFVKLTENFIFFKVSSIFFLLMIILSLFYMSKNKKILWLGILSPVIWYMAPWINPIQIAALLFLWAYFFMEKFDKSEKISYLFFSGVFTGLGWAFYDTIFFLGVLLGAIFLFNKKFYFSFLFLFFVLIGLSPRLILDYALFNFPFYTIIKSTLGTLLNMGPGGIYSKRGNSPLTFFNLFSIFIALPFYFWIIFSPKFFKKNIKSSLLIFSILLIIISNPQIRYTLLLMPIILLNIHNYISEKKFRIYIIFSTLVILLFIAPYIIQIFRPISSEPLGDEFSSTFQNFPNLPFPREFKEESIKKDLADISQDYPHQSFIVGNEADDYRVLAIIYWGDKIKEFISIQDYILYLKNETIFYEKKLKPRPNIPDRRQIWIEGGMEANSLLFKEYSNVSYAISMEDNLILEDFKFVKKYRVLTLWEKKL